MQAGASEVGGEGGHGHGLAEGEVEKVGDPELQGEPHRAHRQDGRGDQPEAEAEDDLVHCWPAFCGSTSPITQEWVAGVKVHTA